MKAHILYAILLVQIALTAKGSKAEQENVSCVLKIKPTGACDSVCSGKPEEILLPFPGNCTKFCHCANNRSWEKDCPDDLHFNAATQRCDWKNEAGCEPSAKPTTAKHTDAPVHTSQGTAAPSAKPTTDNPTDAPVHTSHPTAAPTTASPGKPSVICDLVCAAGGSVTKTIHLPYPGDCSKFCTCANFGNWEKNCLPGLHFNAAKQSCDWKANAGCDPTAKPTTTNPTDAPAHTSQATDAPTTDACILN